MSFDSLAFLFFFVPFLICYHSLPEKLRLPLSLVGSYIFYSSINLAFLPLILFSTIIDYFCGRSIESKPEHKKIFLALSFFLNLGVLFFFKYYPFAANNINSLFHYFNFSTQLPLFDLAFPVGISFYTIQTIGYTIDIYRGRAKAEKNFFKFALFVCFFPQLIAGPLERAGNLISQFAAPFKLNYFQTQKYVLFILIGLAKKTIVSDRLFGIIEHSIKNPTELEYASKNFLNFYLMYYRLYYDFSAYSIMAIGIGGLLGIRLSTNFVHPNFTTNIADFWRQWHITLHDWLKDYIYKPLREKKVNKTIAVFLVFIASGIWHGPNWNFIFWGALNATYILLYHGLVFPFLSTKSFSKTKGFKILSSILNYHLIAVTTPFYFFTDIGEAFHFITNGFTFSYFQPINFYNAIPYGLKLDLKYSLFFLILFEVFSFTVYFRKLSVEKFKSRPMLINALIIFLLICFFLYSKESGPLFRYYYF